MLKHTLLKMSRLSALLLLCLIIFSLRPVFSSPDNLINIVRQASLIVITAAGLTLVIITAGIDLSIGAVLALSAVSGGYLLNNDYPLLIVFLVPLLAGVVVGLINGTLIAYVGLPPFIATYGMLWVAQGAANLFMAGSEYFGFPANFRFIGLGYTLGIPMPIVIMFIVVILLSFLLKGTTLGREVYAYGDNARSAKLSGVHEPKIVLTVYAISGFTAALAGLVFIARLGSADSSISEYMLLPAIASVVIGGTSLFGGQGGITGTLLGALIMTVIINGMNLLEISAYWQSFVTGFVIILSVILDQATKKIEERTPGLNMKGGEV